MKIEIYYSYEGEDEMYQLKITIPWHEIAEVKASTLGKSDEKVVEDIARDYLSMLRGREAVFEYYRPVK